MKGHLARSGAKIVSSDGRPVHLRGVNFGGWLMREAYILQSPNFPEKHFRKNFTKALGEKAFDDWDRSFTQNFIRESDFKQVADWGLNSIRLPFHHRLIETQPYKYDRKGLAVLKQAVAWAKKYGLYVILDLHGACGCQNHDWHCDSDGRAELWTKKIYQDRTIKLWCFLADQFRDETAVAGYDLLNESVIYDSALLKRFYEQLISEMSKIDSRHLFFVEANKWATQPAGLEEIFEHPQAVLSIHSYEPLNCTFNFVPFLSYPSKEYDRSSIQRHHSQYADFSKKYSVPVHVGEFGVNFRANMCGEIGWLKDMLTCFNDFGFHWNYWTYKSVKNSAFPDGIFSYYANPPWVHRLGPKTGWDTYHLHWPDKKKDMIESWHTDQFTLNVPVADCLKHAAKNHKLR